MSDSQGWKPRANPWVVAIIVTLGAFMEVLDTTIVNVSLPHIAGSLSISSDESTWTLTTYLVANGIVLTISGALSRRLGRKNYFLICIGAFTAASFACGISTNFQEILLFRALQGFFGGGLQPTQQAIILDHFPPEKRQQAFSLTAIAIIIAPVVGPVVGGYLTDTYSWHWIFLINIPVGIGTFFGVMQFVEDSPTIEREKKTAPRFDYLGVFFIALALGCLEVGVDRGEDYDWLGSTFIRVMFILSACGFLFGVTYLLSARNPIVNLRVFGDRNFALGSLLIAMMGFVLYASAVLIPQFAQEQLGYTATWAGLVLAPGAVVLTMLIPVAGRLLNLVPAKYVIAAGGLSLGLALFYSMNSRSGPGLLPSDAVPRGADGGAVTAVRADQHDRLRHCAAAPERRCDGALHHVAQRVRRYRHFGFDRPGDGTSANPPGPSDRPSDTGVPAVQRAGATGAAGPGRCRTVHGAGDAGRAGPGVSDAA